MDKTELQDMIRSGRLDELANLIRIQGERIQQLQREKELLENQHRTAAQKSVEEHSFNSSKQPS
jgi:hypothetical protein